MQMITFHRGRKRINKPKHTRLKFDLEKLKDPIASETFQTTISGKFASLIIMNNEDTDMDSMITTINIAVTEAANVILGKHHEEKKKKIPACRKF